ncbi:unnamed protein product [Lactuca saligna]|uniref:Uncharacterized protein n=1 Tax=Lactuca saligna TaxID=75948 RepID=A0AA35YN15_LACSI|nr:unnamed protein product [Lactuca saligna]
MGSNGCSSKIIDLDVGGGGNHRSKHELAYLEDKMTDLEYLSPYLRSVESKVEFKGGSESKNLDCSSFRRRKASDDNDGRQHVVEVSGRGGVGFSVLREFERF